MNDQTVISAGRGTSAGSTFTPDRPKRRTGIIGALLLAAALFGAVTYMRGQRHEAAARFSHESSSAKRAVSAVRATVAPSIAELVLPGNTEAVVISDIYARATGYVRSRHADIGDRVRAGQLLAQIESPELDQDLARARATVEESRAAWRQAQANVTRVEESVVEARARLEQTQANEALASATSERWTRLVQKGVLPRQEGDERQFAHSARKAEVAAAQASIKTALAAVSAAQANVVAAQATTRANEANVSRLERMVAFERVTAPFDGIITERLVEQGDLVASGGGVGGGRKLFAIAQPSILRVQVNVPQTFSADLQQGQEAKLTFRERPGLDVSGKVARTANALQSSSRTLLVEVQVENREGLLLPGMYTEVKFSLPRTHPVTLIPADALLTNSQGMRVAVVDKQGRVRFRSVELGRDLGTQLEVTGGLQPNELLVLNPGETLAEGQEVEIIKPDGQK